MKRILFIDRDGTLIEEPPDQQIDAYEKLRFVGGMIPALLKLRDAGYEFVMVSNQDGLGTAGFPRERFEGPHALMMQLLESQGIAFREVLIDESFAHENKPTRKPGIGLLLHYLRDRTIDLLNSAVIGDRDTDLQLAVNLGCRGFKLGEGACTWSQIAHELADAPRRARMQRVTKETQVDVEIDLDRSADPDIATGLGFFDHMLEQLGKHGGFALKLHCEGDLHIDEHHTVEDSALALGAALREAVADKRGITRYGASDPRSSAFFPPLQGEGRGEAGTVGATPFDIAPISIALPMDESAAQAILDLSGRPYFVFDGRFTRADVGGLPTELVPHFFRSLCESAGLNLHLSVQGENAHHQVEACFKAVARALRQAIRREGRDLPSTKGVL